MKRSQMVKLIESIIWSDKYDDNIADAILTAIEEAGMRPQTNGTCCQSGCSAEWENEEV